MINKPKNVHNLPRLPLRELGEIISKCVIKKLEKYKNLLTLLSSIIIIFTGIINHLHCNHQSSSSSL